MTTRKIVFALAGTAAGGLMIISAKALQASSSGLTTAPAAQLADLAGVPARGVPSGTYEESGPLIVTPFGPVQVRVAVADGRITDVTTLELPVEHGLSQQLSGYAAPILHREVLTAQSTKIDVVSGATYTSNAYAQSLQAALDQVGG